MVYWFNNLSGACVNVVPELLNIVFCFPTCSRVNTGIFSSSAWVSSCFSLLGYHISHEELSAWLVGLVTNIAKLVFTIDFSWAALLEGQRSCLNKVQLWTIVISALYDYHDPDILLIDGLSSISCNSSPSRIVLIRLYQQFASMADIRQWKRLKNTNEPNIASPIMSESFPTALTPSHNLLVGFAAPHTGERSSILPIHIPTKTVMETVMVVRTME